jgi:hypothetical protein
MVDVPNCPEHQSELFNQGPAVRREVLACLTSTVPAKG